VRWVAAAVVVGAVVVAVASEVEGLAGVTVAGAAGDRVARPVGRRARHSRIGG